MSRDEFDALIRRREQEAAAQPRGFLLRTAVLAFGGYAYLLGVMAVMTAVVAGLAALVIRSPSALTFKLALVFGVAAGTVAWAIFRGLWVRLPAPEGTDITVREAPELFAAIRELQQRLGAPPFHRVLVVPEFNAAVVQVPRLGVFGWHRNYLLLGLPLMQALTPDEFRAVLAHEFGHLAGGHGRFGNWLYRLRRTWERTFDEVMRRSPGKAAAPLTWFIGRFWPAFNARAFVLGRTNEYEADAVAGRLVGKEHLAGGLLRINLGAVTLDDDFWPGIRRLAGAQPQPPADVFTRLGAAVSAFAGPAAVRRLQGCLRVPTGNADTHPSLADRLRALGHAAGADTARSLPPPLAPDQTAAVRLLGSALPGLLARLNGAWAAGVAGGWREQHDAAGQLRARLAQAGAPDAPPTPPELWEKAAALSKLGEHEAVDAALDALLAADPQHAQGNFLRGQRLLERDDPAGVPFLERAMAADEEAVPPACGLLYGHYARTGQHGRLRGVEQRMDAFQEKQAAAQAERAECSPQDICMAHGLAQAEVEALQAIFVAEPAVAAVDLVRKRVKHFPESPCYVLAVRVKVPWWQPRSSTANEKLLSRLLAKLPLPGHSFAFIPAQQYKALGRTVAAVTGARVYERAR